MATDKYSNLISASKLAAFLMIAVILVDVVSSSFATPVGTAIQSSSVKGLRPKRNVYGYDGPESEMVNLEPLDYEIAYRLQQQQLQQQQLNQKRGLDMGMSRGFSGNQAAKHMLGLAAANQAHGPGKRSTNRLFAI